MYEINLSKVGSKKVFQYTTKNALEESYTFVNLEKSFFYEFKVRAVLNAQRKGMWLIDTFYVPSGNTLFNEFLIMLKGNFNFKDTYKKLL